MFNPHVGAVRQVRVLKEAATEAQKVTFPRLQRVSDIAEMRTQELLAAIPVLLTHFYPQLPKQL